LKAGNNRNIEKQKKKKKVLKMIGMIALEFNRAKNGILLNFFSPVSLFKFLPV